MKKIFTLALALMGLAGVANAASIDDVKVCKHSYVLVCDDYTNNGTGSRTKGGLFGDEYFLDVTGGSVATNKGTTDLSIVNEADDNHVTADIVAKYSSYGSHLQSLRLKNAQDVIAMKVTAGSKLIFFIHGNNKTGTSARIPKIAKDAALNDALNAAPDAEFPATDTGFRYEWTSNDDYTIYIGSYNGDMFVSYIIVEANEAPGTPSVKVGEQKFEGGLWFREVTCTPKDAIEEGVATKTVVTYTTDGSEPTATSTLYKEPIKCYANMSVKFQAFYDFDEDGQMDAEPTLLEGADNEAAVSFSFDAPTIEANGATFTVTTPYAEQNGKNFYTVNGGEAVEGDGTTLTESATVAAYTEITNGDYGKFTSKSTTQDVYVLNPIKEKKTIAVTAGTAVLDEEATEQSTTGPVYKIEGGDISVEKSDFFVKNLTFAALATADAAKAQYQVPEGQEAYIQMSNTNITFLVADGDSVNVKVICSKNACKNIDAEDAAEDKLVNGCTPDRSCYVNVSGTNYCHLDADGGVAADLKLYPEVANVIEFGLTAGTWTFQKYSGTGNILISSIEITPVATDGIANIKNVEKANSAIFNLAGQKVNANFRGMIIMNGKKFMVK
jgi:hypothetical protein